MAGISAKIFGGRVVGYGDFGEMKFDRGDHVGKTSAKLGSDRTFGFLFAAVFGIAGLFILADRSDFGRLAMAISAIFFILAMGAPQRLHRLNLLWFRFGLLLHRIISPVVMAGVFFVALTPTAAVVLWLGKDPLRRARDDKLASYWISREPPAFTPKSMKNQF